MCFYTLVSTYFFRHFFRLHLITKYLDLNTSTHVEHCTNGRDWCQSSELFHCENHCQRLIGNLAAARGHHVSSSTPSFQRRLQNGGARSARLALGGGWRLHSRQDTDHLSSLCGRDVLGHMHNRIHGNLWIGLNETEERDEDKRRRQNEICLGNRKSDVSYNIWPNHHLRICLRMWSRRMYLMFSSTTDLAPSSSAICLSSQSTTSSLLSHR